MVVTKILKIFVLLVVICGGCYFGVTLVKRQSTVYTIGLLYSPLIPEHERFATQFKAVVQHDSRFNIIEFTPASLDQMVLASACDTALESNADIFVTTGQRGSQTLIKLSQRRGILKPIVFSGIADPVILGIVDTVERPGHNATGFFCRSPIPLFNEIDLILLVKPNVRTILMPYVVGENAGEERLRMLKAYAEERGIKVTLFPIDVLSDTLHRVASKLPGHDVVTYININSIAQYAGGIGKLASEQGVTLVAFTSEGSETAAVVSVPLQDASVEPIFTLVKRVCIDQEAPGGIPAELMISRNTLTINTQVCAEQDLLDIDIVRIKKCIAIDSRFEKAFYKDVVVR